jgi:hypothetical protein
MFQSVRKEHLRYSCEKTARQMKRWRLDDDGGGGGGGGSGGDIS